MPTRRSFIASWLSVLALLGAASATTPIRAKNPTRLAIVVASDSPINDLSFHDLKRLYGGDQVNAAGKRLVPLNQGTESQDRQGFDQVVLGLSAEEAARYWIDRKIRGQSGSPKAIDPPNLLMKVVMRLNGSLGYVQPGTLQPGLKVLRIDGKLPDDKGYPIVY
jgi:hypothetical protein